MDKSKPEAKPSDAKRQYHSREFNQQRKAAIRRRRVSALGTGIRQGGSPDSQQREDSHAL